MVPLDGTWLYLLDFIKNDTLLSINRGKNTTKWVREYKENFLKRFMIAAGFFYESKLVPKNVLNKAKVDSFYY